MNHTIYLTTEEWGLIALAITAVSVWSFTTWYLVREHLRERRAALGRGDCPRCGLIRVLIRSPLADGTTHRHCPYCGWRSRG